MASFNLIVFVLAVYQFQVTLTIPRIGSLSHSHGPTCRSFQHSYCNRFNYNITMSPNPRQTGLSFANSDAYIADAAKEFSHFAPLLDSGCSDKLGSLLCFLYFPFCATIPGEEPDTTQEIVILPCRGLCEEITAGTSKCTEELEKANLTWAAQFDCRNFRYNGKPVYIEPSEENNNGIQLCVNDTLPWLLPAPDPEPDKKEPKVKPDPLINPIRRGNEFTCRTFQHNYCNSFGYYTTMSPNPRQTDLTLASPDLYIADAALEFSHFTRLLDSGCSDKLGTLLCFLYFPFCSIIPDSAAQEVVFPCRSVCEEVTNVNSKCTEEMKKYNISWADHFNCSMFQHNGRPVYIDPSEGTGLCTNDTQMPWGLTPTPPTTTQGPTDPVEPTTDQLATTATADEIPDYTTPAPSCGSVSCSTKCGIRRGANVRTFDRNDYTFAARVRVQSVNFTENGRRKWTCELVEQFGIKSGPPECKKAPPMDDNFDLLGDGRTCERDCYSRHQTQLEPGKEYLIAGYYQTNECDAVEYLVPGEDSLIGEWKPDKYTAKKMTNTVNRGNTARKC